MPKRRVANAVVHVVLAVLMVFVVIDDMEAGDRFFDFNWDLIFFLGGTVLHFMVFAWNHYKRGMRCACSRA